jgi:SAM-dependent methyltransferase
MNGPTMTEPERPDLRTDIPHGARVYDYLLGGKDNFAADRDAARWALQQVPQMLDIARGNRAFMIRATRFLCEAGIRQFLDIGAGLPTSPNSYEIAQSADPGARVVYVDNDPMVYLHAEALMAKNDRVSVVRADLLDVDDVLGHAARLLDFSEPVGLMFVSCLHHVEGDHLAEVVARYLAVLAPGSYLVLSHVTDEFGSEAMRATSKDAARRGAVFLPRGRDEIEGMFNGRKLLDPGLVLVSRWRPDNGDPGPNADRAWAYGGVAEI